MKFQDITKEALLQSKNIRSVDFEHEWYFVYQDMNNEFMGAFNNSHTIPLPILKDRITGERELMKCISYSDIQATINTMTNKSDFERHINTALNFNYKKK